MEVSYIVKAVQSGRELRQLALGPWGFSQKMWKRVKWNGRILVNGVEYHNARYRVASGDVVKFFWQEKTAVVPAAMPLDILYEDDILLLVNKPAGMLIHPTHRTARDTLVHAVAGYFSRRGEVAGVHPLYRLDRDTTGVVVIAKSAKVQHELTRSHDQIYREYLAVAAGHFQKKQGRIALPLGPNPARRGCWQVRSDGRKAVTDYEVCHEGTDYSVVRLHLLTGRTHQIRVHLSSLGHPLLGDAVYGGSCARIGRQALHAYIVRFRHPETGTEIFCQAPVSKDMRSLFSSCFT